LSAAARSDYIRAVRLFLIGYMGSGKTTIGNLLADALSIPFYDTDQEVEKSAHLDIASIFSQLGEPHFRALERSTLERLITEHENAVIATGGGLPCNEENLEAMKRNGTVIYLKCAPGELFQRILADTQDRPLKKINEHELETHLSAREKFYSTAPIIVDSSRPTHEVVQDIREML
jgi:shikimate kinase